MFESLNKLRIIYPTAKKHLLKGGKFISDGL